MLSSLEVVALTVDFPEYALKAGDIGTVVDIQIDEYTVEFVRQDGHTVALIDVQRDEIRSIDRAREILNSRRIEA